MQRNLFGSDESKPVNKPLQQEVENDQWVFSREYLAYLRSAQWQKRRKEALKRAGYRCEHCHKPFVPSKLHLHHLNYERLGNELPSDLLVLCVDCHKLSDAERREEKAADNSARLYEAQVCGWASKVYGEDWESYKDFLNVAIEFDEWLEEKERRGDW